MYPRRTGWKRSALAALSGALLLAGCGGGGHGSTTAAAAGPRVAGPGFGFALPSGWQAEHGTGTVTIRPASGQALASVTVLPLRKRYRPDLFQKAKGELDRVTAALAARLNGKVVASRAVAVAGAMAHQYDVAFSRGGTPLVDRITYVFRGLSEYELLCQWPVGEGEPSACALLTSSFRIGS